MIVVDASAMVLALADAGPAGQGARLHLGNHSPWCVPAHMPIEVVRTFIRQARAGLMPADEAHALAMQMHDGVGAAVVTMPARDLLPAIWQLHHTISPYDGAYVALAQTLDAALLTADRRLAKASTDLVAVIEVSS